MVAPLKGGTGEVGQSLMDLGGAEGEDLFNRTARPQKPAESAKSAASSRKAAVKAARTLGMDSALSDAQLRAKMREWGRHAEDPRFKARLDAAEVILADRAAKGKAELTDEDKAMQRILGGTRFKRGEESREYEDVVRRFHNADGTAKRGWMKAPNGKPTKLTERQWVQVRTPSFKRWFGDWENDPENASKVVDENGEPMVVYHATDWNPFEEKPGEAVFKASRRGLHFFATTPAGARRAAATGNDLTLSCFINARNIRGEKGPGIYFGYAESDKYQSRIRDAGYDGVKIRDEANGTIAVFSPTQIKSATDNTGAFDPQNPDIRYKRGDAARYGIGSSAVNGKGFADLEAGDTYEKVFRSLTSRTNEEVRNETLGITAKIGSNRNANHLIGKNSTFGDEDAEAHKYAAKNVLALLAKADVGILHRDKKGTRNDYIRAFAPFAFGDGTNVATITLRRESAGDRIYTVEAVEVESGDSPRTSRRTAQEAQSPVSMRDRIAYYVGDVKATKPRFLGSETPFGVDALAKRISDSVASFKRDKTKSPTSIWAARQNPLLFHPGPATM